MPTKKIAPESEATQPKPARARSSKNWEVTDLTGMTGDERKEHERKPVEKMTAPAKAKQQAAKKVHNVSPENEKSAEIPLLDKQTVKSYEKQPENKPTRGRPSTFTQAIADEICDRIANGEPLREICRIDGMPAWRTVYDWQRDNKEFSARIANSRELGEEAIFQDCLHIADTPLIGEETETSENGVKVKRSDMLGHRKLQIDTRLKLLAKWNPRKWGEKLDLNHGGQPNNPVQTTTRVVMVPAKERAVVETRQIDKQVDEN